jgi:C4-dicarboxylate-specific signal transduction histidine kinase
MRSVVGNSGPLLNGSKVIDRVVGSMRDVTQRVTDQEQIAVQQAELLHVSRLSTLGMTSAAISHELNQPLTAAANFASACEGLLEGRTDEFANRLRGYVKEMSKQCLRAGQIVRRLSEFSRKSPNRWSTVDLNLVLLDSVALIEVELRAKKTRLRHEFSTNLPPIQGDRVQLQQVFVNLLSNAADAMQGIPEDDRWVTISCSRESDCLLVQIDDQGPGISPEAAERIFQPFVTTKSNHSGIGLSICQTIIESHGGEITFAPSPPRGTRFAVKLPLSHRVVRR